MLFSGVENSADLEYYDGAVGRILVNPTTCYGWDFIDRESGVVIGNGGYHKIDSRFDCAELGYYLHQPFRRKGYMSELLPVILKHGFETNQYNRIEAYVSIDNEPSLKLLSKFEFNREGIMKEKVKSENAYEDVVAFRLLASEYAQCTFRR